MDTKDDTNEATGAVANNGLLEVNPYDSPEYEKFCEDMTGECVCCIMCSEVPCAGLLAGGPCDSMCSCDDDIYEDDEDDGSIYFL